MSKLSFRARALDPSKSMPIYRAEDIPDLPEYAAINRAVPQMPSGMEKEEESEHHLQRAIVAGQTIPTPEVTNVQDNDFYNKNYPADYKMPRQMIHMQPLSMEQDIPDYDMDTADEQWVTNQMKRLDLTPLKFEQMMDRLEKSTGQTVTTLNEAKSLLNQDDEVSTAVFDYWLNKRLRTEKPLLFTVKTENRGNVLPNNPYLAFRRRTEKMQTRKNRKNDETSYEKMLKLRRDLSRVVTLMEMVKRREKTKREQLHLGIEIYEKRYHAKDFAGQLLAEYTTSATKQRPAFAPLYANQYSPLAGAQSHSSTWGTSHNSNHYSNHHHHNNNHSQYHHSNYTANKRELDGISTSSSRKEKRQYKKRKHKPQREKPVSTVETILTSDEEDLSGGVYPAAESEDEGCYPFRRNKSCNYFKPHTEGFGNWPWEGKEDNGTADPKYRFTLTSIRQPRPRCIGFARRRMGRGGRVILDRIHTSMDDVWSKLDYTIFDSEAPISEHPPTSLKTETPLTAPEIVINREPATQPPDFLRQHIKQESMDDFEQLLDNANASFNIHKHTIREQTSRLTYAQSSSGISSMSSSSQSILPPNLLLEGEHNTEDSNAEQKVDEEDFYQTMLDEIRTDWLHFRPRTPDESDVLFDSDLLSSEFSVELQALAEQDSYHLDPIACLDSEDVYLSEPFAPDCFTTTPQHIPSQSRQNSSLRLKLDTSTSESELNVSGDSLSLSLHEESEQMLDNILQECQIDDIGALNQTSNFCNELLADDDLPQLDLVNVPERKGKRKLGYCSEYVEHGGKRSKSNRCQRVVGCSSFELLQAPPKDLFQTPEIKDIVKANDCFVPPIETKVEVDSEWKDPVDATTSTPGQSNQRVREEPIAELQSHNYVLQYGPPISTTANFAGVPLNTIFTSAGNSPLPTGIFQQQKIQPIQLENNTIVLTASPAGSAANSPRRQLNGPERNVNQPQKKQQIIMLDLLHQQQEAKRRQLDGLKKAFTTEIGGQNIIVSTANPNLLSSHPVQQAGQQFSLIQKPSGTILKPNTSNKIILTATPHSSAVGTMSNVNYTIGAQQLQDLLGQGKIILPTVKHQQTAQPQSQQRRVNMMIDYTKNPKYIQKVAGLLPMQAKPNSMTPSIIANVSAASTQQLTSKRVVQHPQLRKQQFGGMEVSAGASAVKPNGNDAMANNANNALNATNR